MTTDVCALCALCGRQLNSNVESGICMGCSEVLDACETEHEAENFRARQYGEWFLRKCPLAQLNLAVGRLLLAQGNRDTIDWSSLIDE